MEAQPAQSPAPRPELAYRLKQQRLLAKFGRMALREGNLDALLQRAAELCSDGLDAPFCKVLEWIEGSNELLLRAGVGWSPREIGRATLAVDLESPAGCAFNTGEPVLSNHLQGETRFRTPKLLRDYGIRRAVNVLIDLGGRRRGPFGVLEVDSPDPGQFDTSDVTFLAGCAGILGAAIERLRVDAQLRGAIDRQALLMREMSHRIKNSLGMVSGILRLGDGTTSDNAAKKLLMDAERRVMTIAQVHDSLWRGDQIGEIDLGRFLEELCGKLGASTGAAITCSVEPLSTNADYAIPVGLIVNELVTNAIKHADAPAGRNNVLVSLRAEGGTATIEVADNGRGLPQGFQLDASRTSFGMRVVTSLVQQLQGSITVEPAATGARFAIRFPLDVAG